MYVEAREVNIKPVNSWSLLDSEVIFPLMLNYYHNILSFILFVHTILFVFWLLGHLESLIMNAN